MFKQWVNELRLGWTIIPRGPLLIKSGRESGADPTLLDMNFVRIHHGELGETVYLPGSSLKGTLRSYCERIARTVAAEHPEGKVRCCNPLDTREACDKKKVIEKARKSGDGMTIYRELCSICRVFGHTVQAGHLRVGDAYPPQALVEETNRTEQRDGVAIDRRTGGAAPGALYTLEIVTRGAFEGDLTLRNFQLWQVGLLALALRDLSRGRVPIGFGKSRGLGQVEVSYRQMEVSYPAQVGPGEKRFGERLYGVTQFEVGKKEGGENGYHFFPELSIPLPAGAVVEDDWGQVRVRFEGHQAVEALLKATVPAWAAYALGQPMAEGGGDV
jgi:CRISPR-associated RAMP protein (TIGR02581 family)